MGLLWTILLGFLAGAVAKLLFPGRVGGGFVPTTALGILGAVVAGYLGQALGLYRAGEGAGFLGSVVGAAILLAMFRAFGRG